MTFVGKILVVLISLLAMVFLGVSVVVFSTATNWQEATKKELAKVADFQKKNSDLDAQLKQEQANLEKAKADHAAAVKLAETRIETLQNEIKQAQAEVTTAQGALEKLNQSNAVALAEAAQRRSETEQVRGQKSEVEKQANDFKIQQTDLIDKIRELNARTRRSTTTTRICGTGSPGSRLYYAKRASRTTFPPRKALITLPPWKARSPRSTPPARQLRSRSDRTTDSFRVTNFSPSASNPCHSISAKSRSRRSTPIRPSARSWDGPSKASS